MIALALQTAAAFNLICTMTAHHLPDARGTVIRVDLEGRRWCLEECRYSYPIAAVTEAEIIFQDGRQPSGSFIYRRVNRRDGGMETIIRDPDDAPETETRILSVCRRAPFGGIPRASWAPPPG